MEENVFTFRDGAGCRGFPKSVQLPWTELGQSCLIAVAKTTEQLIETSGTVLIALDVSFRATK